MLKVLTFGKKDVQFSTSFAWAFIYKSQFGHDPAKILMPVIRDVYDMDEPVPTGDEEADKAAGDAFSMRQTYALYEQLGFTGIVQIAWSMAKLCDHSIPNPITWVASFGDDFVALDLVTGLLPEAIESCFTTKKSEVPPSDGKTEETAPKK